MAFRLGSSRRDIGPTSKKSICMMQLSMCTIHLPTPGRAGKSRVSRVTTGGGAMAESVIQSIETEIALLFRRADATARAAPGSEHRALDRAAYVILRQLEASGDLNVGALAALLG